MRRAQARLGGEWLGLGAGKVWSERLKFDGWQEGAAGVEMIAPARQRFDGIQAIHSRPGRLTGLLVEGGSLGFGDLQRIGDSARGSILLIDGHQIAGGQFEPIQKRISLAEAMGAGAVLLVGWHARLPSIQFLNRSRIPVVSLAQASAKALRRWLRRGPVRLRVTAGGRTRKVACFNLIAELGPARARETLVACAHLDCFYLSPAALDNTSGIVTMTEAARALAPYQRHFKRKLRLIAFTGEEYGYAGSKAYVRAHAGELNRIPFVFSMDCMFESTAEGLAVMWSPSMRKYIARGLHRKHPPVDVRNLFCMSSDYLPFMLAGIPAARPADWKNSFPPWTHTIRDTGDKIPSRWLKSNAELAANVLLRMLVDPKPLPSTRLSEAQVQAAAVRDRAVEALRWQVLLPA